MTPPEAARAVPRCWCGNPELAGFSETYGACRDCGTLVSTAGLRPVEAEVRDDERDFYGKSYWLARQREELGFPDIYERARLDLPERCVHWLRALLAHRLPPARVLELGSGHGAFVALLRAAGFDATGLELSPWVVDFSRSTFGVPVLLGPVESQALPPSGLDVVVLNDVIEHLVDPRATLGHCVRLLAPDGAIQLQTPCFPEGSSHRELVEANHPFLAMLQPREHLYLFSPRAIGRLCAEQGLPHVRIEPALFPYDMAVVAGRAELAATDPERRRERLLASGASRLVLALLDLDDRAREASVKARQVEDDRQERIAMIARLNLHLEETSRDNEARGRVIDEQRADLDAIENDRQERIAMIARLNLHLEETSRDNEARGRVIDEQQATIARVVAANEAQAHLLADQQGTIDKLVQQRDQLAAFEASVTQSLPWRILRALRLV